MFFLLRRAALLAGMALLLLFVAGCGAYLSTSYEVLRQWYLSLNPCFYRASEWAEHFFSPATKIAGNGWAFAGLLLSLICGSVLLSQRKACWKRAETKFKMPPEISVLLLFWLGGILLWLWGNSHLPPASDEVFSYENVARLPLFQSCSYYMLPNNHVGFNVLNNLLQRLFPFGLLSGRLLSLFAYLGTVGVIFYWLRAVVTSKALRYLILAGLATQSMTLLFAFQARGYALYTFAAWVAFAITHRLLAGGNRRFSKLLVPAVISGYAVLPSFLYVHVALMLWIFVAQIQGRKDLGFFWRAQFVIAAGVFLFYLPVLLFSGLPALTENKWVHSVAPGFPAFLEIAFPTARYYIFHEFTGATEGLPAQLILLLGLLLPLLLYPFIRGKNGLLRGAFVCFWATFVLFSLLLRQLPPGRSLSPLFSISMALSLATAAKWTSQNLSNRKFLYGSIPVFISVSLFVKCPLLYPGQLQTAMYGPSVAEVNKQAAKLLQTIPATAQVGFGDEAFYFRFLWEQAGRKSVACPAGKEAYLLFGQEEIPPAINFYEQRASALDVHCYRRRTLDSNTQNGFPY